jgi:hypothetical protein
MVSSLVTQKNPLSKKMLRGDKVNKGGYESFIAV